MQQSSQSHRFPAPCGPASLKRDRIDHWMRILDRFPAPCGPASLKQVESAELPGAPITFSGPLRAGLIEASRPSCYPDACDSFPAPCGPASLKPIATALRQHRAAGFPAPCGPASLKPPPAYHTPPPPVTFSGPLRAGLIEALITPRWYILYPCGFPAPCGPASLKRSVFPGRARRRRVFRPLAGRTH